MCAIVPAVVRGLPQNELAPDRAESSASDPAESSKNTTTSSRDFKG
jgi:hypothetical protein